MIITVDFMQNIIILFDVYLRLTTVTKAVLYYNKVKDFLLGINSAFIKSDC